MSLINIEFENDHVRNIVTVRLSRYDEKSKKEVYLRFPDPGSPGSPLRWVDKGNADHFAISMHYTNAIGWLMGLFNETQRHVVANTLGRIRQHIPKSKPETPEAKANDKAATDGNA